MRGRKLNRAAGLAFWVLAALVPQCANAQSSVKVTLRTDYKVNGYVGVFALAQERGFYRAQGLNVEIGEGQGSSTTVQTVAAGDDTFGLADATALTLAVSLRKIPVKAVAVYSQTGIQGFLYHPEPGWDGKIEGMRGKVLVSSPGSAELTLIPAALASAGMTMNDINLQLVDAAAKVPLFIRTPAAFMGGYATGDLLRVKLRMPNVGYAPFSNYGVVAFGTALITKDRTIQENPELVRKFVAASEQAWELASKDPNAAVAAAMKLFPESDPHLLLDGLKIMIASQLHTPASAGKPIGWTAKSDWSDMLDMLKKYANVKPAELTDLYTNEFIPMSR